MLASLSIHLAFTICRCLSSWNCARRIRSIMRVYNGSHQRQVDFTDDEEANNLCNVGYIAQVCNQKVQLDQTDKTAA